MSRKGDCRDNAVTETLFGSQKVERRHAMRCETRRIAKDEMFEKKSLASQIRLAARQGRR